MGSRYTLGTMFTQEQINLIAYTSRCNYVCVVLFVTILIELPSYRLIQLICTRMGTWSNKDKLRVNFGELLTHNINKVNFLRYELW